MLEVNKITKILYVDDDEIMLENFKSMFSSRYEIITTDCPLKALKKLMSHDVQIIISDQRMPKMTGIELFTEILKTRPNPIRILLTGFNDLDVIIDAINQGHIYYYLRKPFSFDQMLKILINASKLYHLRKSSTDALKIT